MYHNAAASCDRHLAKHMRDVLGKDKNKDVRISKVSHDAQYRCHCGIFATWYLRANKHALPATPNGR